MSRFNKLTDLKKYVDGLVLLGLGHAQPMLDRRGCDCSSGPAPLSDPGDGERVSEDGTKVYLTSRVKES